ncbi:GNAT family N-acetyltransferase [Mycolicibacterium sp. HK-90]|uniref:GNAT family N-acetyltransferase n=1 Tax=Mycolicibacterium sp. HK-90 TaxID=3056937 RepID=UPI00265B5E61|nr:GNAT family N-acetyltransferase [Mycolicibacterium sp. HK-90]WKG02174.1 GNAT family N-acetyltransferase [Mycolicibacterium sp. HK-90]
MTIADRLPEDDGDVRVRQLRHGDAEAFAAGTKDAGVRRYGHLPLADYSPDIVREQIDGVIAQGLDDGSLAVLAIADASSDRFLGSIVLFDFRADHAEVGFWLCPEARGRGVAQKAMRLIADVAADAGLTQLRARTAPENNGSIRALEGVGFVQTDGPREERTPSGELATVLAFERSVVEDRA